MSNIKNSFNDWGKKLDWGYKKDQNWNWYIETNKTVEIAPVKDPNEKLLKGALGILFIDNDKLKLRTIENEEFDVIDLNGKEDLTQNLLTLIAKMQLYQMGKK